MIAAALALALAASPAKATVAGYRAGAGPTRSSRPAPGFHDASRLAQHRPERAFAAAFEIVKARDVEQALERLQALGVLKAADVAPDPVERMFQLMRIWDNVSPAYLESEFSFDYERALPAIVTVLGERTVVQSGINHYKLMPANRFRVLGEVRRIAGDGHALYSEHPLPQHYGYTYGKSIDDRLAEQGGTVAARPAAREGLDDRTLLAGHALIAGALLVAAAVAAHASVVDIGGAAGWALAAIVGGSTYLVFSGLREAYWLGDIAKGWLARLDGRQYEAAQLFRRAAALHRRVVDPMDLLRLELPPGPGAALDPLRERSEAFLAAALADAERAGRAAIHFIDGYNHTALKAWRLREQVPTVPSRKAQGA